MCKNSRKIFLIILILTIFFDVVFFVKKTFFREDLINIDDLSQEFMDNFFDDVSSIKEEDKKNMLIVTSKYKLKDTYGASKVIEAPNHQYFLIYGSENDKNTALEQFKNDSRIQNVNENNIYKLYYNSWGIEKMSLDYAINSANANISYMNPVTVAVIDSGCDMTLFSKYFPGRVSGVYDVLSESDLMISDSVGHGTLVASVVAEATPSNVSIFPVSVTKSSEIYEDAIIAGVDYIVRNEKADVINMSLGGAEYSESLKQAIDSANKKNIIVVASSGNKGNSVLNYPASFDSTISVGSVDSELNLSSFSSYGEKVTFVAPGSQIRSVGKLKIPFSYKDGDEDFDIVDGTSFSTPHVSAAVAILKGYNKDINLEDTIDILKYNAIDLGDEGWDQYYGYGFVSLENIDFCTEGYCGEYGIYSDSNKHISGIEVGSVTFTEYNYYSLTNILGTRVTFRYSDNSVKNISLGSLSNVEILNYDPYKTERQIVTVKLGEFITEMEVVTPDNLENGWEYNILSDGKIEITGYKNHNLSIEKLYVPEFIDSKQVVAFADNFEFSKFGDVDNYISLYLPNSFNRIGNYSLSQTSFKYVYGSSDGIEVGAHAFENSSIVSIEMPLTKVEDYAFAGCNDLVMVELYKAETYQDFYIGSYAFYNSSHLSSIELLNENLFVENIGSYAFYGCHSLSFFNLKPTNEIGEYAFYSTYLLSDVDLGSVSRIGTRAFQHGGISKVNIISLDTIESEAFDSCRNLKKVSINYGTIESAAFSQSGIETLILNNVNLIAEDAFIYNPIKSSGDFSSETGKYKTIQGLGIVEASTNKLMIGFTNNFNLTDDITEIGDYAFLGNSALERVIIPSTVTRIGSYAFSQCVNLSQVYMLGDYIEFGDSTFSSDVYIYVYNDSPMKQYVIGKNLNYRHIVPDGLIVSGYEQDYRFFSKVDTDALVVKLIYYDDEFREEEIPLIDVKSGIPVSPSFGYEVIYQNESDSFQPGDTQFTVSAKDSLGHLLTLNVPVTLNKAIPSYILPDEVNGLPGQTLSEIALPSGFEWMDGSQTIDDYGEFIYKARYIPDDKTIYEIVENIDIKVVVTSKEIINPEITIQKKYNFMKNISLSNITVSNLDTSEYSIVKAESLSPDAGQTTAVVGLRLSDEKFETCSFSNGLQEKEFMVDFEIQKADFNSLIDLENGSDPIYIGRKIEDVVFLYDGSEHRVKYVLALPAYDSLKFMDENGDYVLDTAPSYSDVGIYHVYYGLFDKNFNDYFGEVTLVIEPFLLNDYSSNKATNYESDIISIPSLNTNWNLFTQNVSLGNGFSFELDENDDGEIMYTGQKIKLIQNIDSSNNLFKEYIVSVKGDLNGNGVISSTDFYELYKLRRKIKSGQEVELAYKFAGDINNDGTISSTDFYNMYKLRRKYSNSSSN